MLDHPLLYISNRVRLSVAKKTILWQDVFGPFPRKFWPKITCNPKNPIHSHPKSPLLCATTFTVPPPRTPSRRLLPACLRTCCPRRLLAPNAAWLWGCPGLLPALAVVLGWLLTADLNQPAACPRRAQRVSPADRVSLVVRRVRFSGWRRRTAGGRAPGSAPLCFPYPHLDLLEDLPNPKHDSGQVLIFLTYPQFRSFYYV